MVATRNTPTHQKATLHLLAGGIGTTFAQCVTCPLDVVQTRLQSSHLNFSSLGNISTIIGKEIATGVSQIQRPLPGITYFQILHGYMRHIVRVEGVKSLFKGLCPSLFGIVPMKSLYFFCYSDAKNRFGQTSFLRERPHMKHSLSAVVAQSIVGTVTNPIWYVKTRLQLNRKAKYSVIEVVRNGYQKHGVKGFFRGLSATYVGVFESVIYFVIYEHLKNVMQLNSRRHYGENFQPSSLVFATLLSKIIATTIMYPHEVIRTRLRQDVKDSTGCLKYRNFVQTLKLVYKEEGRAGVYGGFGTSLLRQLPYTTVMFLTYEGIIFMVSVDQ